MEPTAPGPSQQLIAMYDTYEAAQFARDRLLDAGLTASEVDIRGESPGHVDPGYGPADEGFWNAVRLFLLPQDETDYAEAMRRGHVMLIVRPRPEHRQQALDILEASNPVDLEGSLRQWREETAGSGGVATQTARDVPPSAGGADVTGVQAGPTDPLASARASRESIGRVRSYALDPPGTYAVPRMSGAPEEGGAGKSKA